MKKILFVLMIIGTTIFGQTKIPTPDSAKAWYSMPEVTSIDTSDKFMIRRNTPLSHVIRWSNAIADLPQFDSASVWSNVVTFDSTVYFNDSVYFNHLVWFDSTVEFNQYTFFDSAATFNDTVNFNGSADFNNSVYLDSVLISNDTAYFNSDAVFDLTSEVLFRDTVTFDGNSEIIIATKTDYVAGSEILLPALWSSSLDRSFGTNGGLMLFNYSAGLTDTMISRRYLRNTTELNTKYARLDTANTFTSDNTFSGGYTRLRRANVDSSLTFSVLAGLELPQSQPLAVSNNGMLWSASGSTESILISNYNLTSTDTLATREWTRSNYSTNLLPRNNTWSGTNDFQGLTDLDQTVVNDILYFAASNSAFRLPNPTPVTPSNGLLWHKTNSSEPLLLTTYNTSSVDTLATRRWNRANDAGEDNTASNVGAGDGWFKQKSASDLQFKSFITGTDLTVSNNANDLTLSLSSNIPRLNGSNTWTSTNTFNSTVGLNGTTTVNSNLGFGSSGRLTSLNQASLLFSYELAFLTGTNLIATYGVSSLDTLATRSYSRDNATYLLNQNNTWTGTNNFNTSLTSIRNAKIDSVLRFPALAGMILPSTQPLAASENGWIWQTSNASEPVLITNYNITSVDTLSSRRWVRNNVNTSDLLSLNNTWTGTNTYSSTVTLNSLSVVNDLLRFDSGSGLRLPPVIPSVPSNGLIWQNSNSSESLLMTIYNSSSVDTLATRRWHRNNASLPSNVAYTDQNQTFTGDNTFSGGETRIRDMKIDSVLAFPSLTALILPPSPPLATTTNGLLWQNTGATEPLLITNYNNTSVDTLATRRWHRNNLSSGNEFDSLYTDRLIPLTASQINIDIRSKSTGGAALGFYDVNQIYYGRFYASAPTAPQLGFLDKDNHWSYKHISDDRHEWSINNTEHMQLDEDGLFINNSLAIEENNVTSGATIDVSDKTFLQLDYSATTTITNFTNGVVGQLLYITKTGGASVTIQNDNSNIHLEGSTNLLLPTNSMIILMKSDNGWIQAAPASIN